MSIFGGDEIECYLSIQGMYGYILIILGYGPRHKNTSHLNKQFTIGTLLKQMLMQKQKTTHPEYKHEEQNPTMMLTIPMTLVDQKDELLHPSN